MTIVNTHKKVSAEDAYVVTEIRIDGITEQFVIRNGSLVFFTQEDTNPFYIDEETGHLIYVSEEEEPSYRINEETGHLMTTKDVGSENNVLRIIKQNFYSDEIIQDTFFLDSNGRGSGSVIIFSNELANLLNGGDE